MQARRNPTRKRPCGWGMSLMLLKHMARTDKSAFRKFMQDKEQAAAVDIDKELKQAVNLGKFGMPDRVYSSISANSWVSRL